MKLRNQRTDSLHVFHTVVKGHECLIVLDIFVLRQSGLSLVVLHGLQSHLKIISINIVPKGLLQRVELAVNDGDQIPHLLQLYELILAFLEFLLLGPLEFEELLKNLELFGFFLHLSGLVVIFTNLFICSSDYFIISILDFMRHCRLELKTIVEDLDLELADTDLDIVRLL